MSVTVSVADSGELAAILDAARTDLGNEGFHYRVAADWCEERGDGVTAAGLRRMADQGRRPQLGCRLAEVGHGWHWSVPSVASRRTVLRYTAGRKRQGLPHWVSQRQREALAALAPGGGYWRDVVRFADSVQYRTFDRAVLALAAVLGEGKR